MGKSKLMFLRRGVSISSMLLNAVGELADNKVWTLHLRGFGMLLLRIRRLVTADGRCKLSRLLFWLGRSRSDQAGVRTKTDAHDSVSYDVMNTLETWIPCVDGFGASFLLRAAILDSLRLIMTSVQNTGGYLGHAIDQKDHAGNNES
jgi:hypothetical protein